MNFYSQELQLHEIEVSKYWILMPLANNVYSAIRPYLCAPPPPQKICTNPEAHKRVLKSYEMMLDFYGMRLKDPSTGMLWTIRKPQR